MTIVTHTHTLSPRLTFSCHLAAQVYQVGSRQEVGWGDVSFRTNGKVPEALKSESQIH